MRMKPLEAICDAISKNRILGPKLKEDGFIWRHRSAYRVCDECIGFYEACRDEENPFRMKQRLDELTSRILEHLGYGKNKGPNFVNDILASDWYKLKPDKIERSHSATYCKWDFQSDILYFANNWDLCLLMRWLWEYSMWCRAYEVANNERMKRDNDQ